MEETKIEVLPLKADAAQQAFGRDMEQEEFETAMSNSQVFPVMEE